MLDPGGGSGNGGTNWYGRSVPDMWTAMANQQTDNHWTLLTGWRKSYELTLQHMSAVRNYRENLAAAWPPDKSAASAAYLQRLDDLLANLQQTYDAAVANYSTFSTATLALDSARHELKTVYDEYVTNEGKLAAHQREVADGSATGNGTSSEKPPVADGRQAELEARARSIMYGLSAELAAATTQIRQPPLYQLARTIDASESSYGGSTYTPPQIPPIVPSTATSGASATDSPSAPSHAPVTATSTSPAPARQPGLVLGGVELPAVSSNPPPPPGPPSPGHIAPIPPTAVGSGSLPTPRAGAVPPIAPTLPSPNGSARSGPNVPTQNPNAGLARPMAPGGIIGAPPGAGLGQPGASKRLSSNVNPIGGVIGPGSQPGGPRNASGHSSLGTQPIASGGRNASRKAPDDEAVPRWDPDNPWETPKGVAPVVLPPVEQRIDPGPAIGLS